MKRSIVVPFIVILALVASGCGSSKARELRSWDVEDIAQRQLSSKGKPAPPVSCKDPLDAYVGARTVCSITIQGKPHDVTMTVTSVTGRQVNFDIEVAEEPRPPAPKNEKETPPT